MKKALIVATVYKFLNFEKNDIKILKEMGYEVHCATNMNSENWLKDDGSLDELGFIKHQIDFGRSPFSRQSLLAYKQLKKLIAQEEFQLMHCHTPVAAAIARCAGFWRHASKKMKVIYTCHIRQKDTGINYYIEINPRFGGGSPLSMRAGARSAEEILHMLLGETVSYREDDINDQAVYSRFDQCVCINRGIDKQSVKGVIFDLDDTLYDEKDYVRSGYKAVAAYLDDPAAADAMWKFFAEGKPAIDAYLQSVGKEDEKDACLKVYREHIPDIKLREGAAELITFLKARNIMVGIITDGRVSGQEKKLSALGLYEMIDDIIITDSLGGVQFRNPNDISFRIMQNRWRIPFEQIVYVGDNPAKDFQASKQLGMNHIVFYNRNGLYSSTYDNYGDFSQIGSQLIGAIVDNG